jgi:uncharacterized membrane protein YeiH
VRDVVLDRPAVMLHDMNYLLVILGAAMVTALFARCLKRYEGFFKYVDALGLGVFSAIGASLAVSRALSPISVLFIASITGAAGA